MYGHAGSAAGTVTGAGALAYTGAPLLGFLVLLASGLVVTGILAFRFSNRKRRERGATA